MRVFFLTILMCCLTSFSAEVFGQTLHVKGTVTDEAKVPLPGVSVVIKGSNKGTTTDFDGKYELNAKKGDVLVFSFVGFTTQEKAIPATGGGNSLIINTLLKEETQQLGEVVVTALGIKREKKSLGYALQEVKGDELAEAREANLANAFTGKVAGLQIVKGSNGPGGSSKIILRGNNSLTGDNQPLIVVDGVPMDNFTGASNNDFWNPSADFGNGLGDLNPDDIESMSVLKGPAAAALYGSRAGNGVILITTKSGKAREGLGISISSTVGFENIFLKPALQNQFGQGSQGIYNNLSASNWGPKIEGQSVEKWDTTKAPLAYYDNIDAYFKTGISLNHSISFQQQISNGTSLYSSVTYFEDDSKIPGATLNRMNLLTRAVSKFGKDNKWTSDVKVQYINSKAQNRPVNGNNPYSSYGIVAGLPNSLDINDFRNGTRVVNEQNVHYWYNPSSGYNPFWLEKYRLNQDERDRFLLNGSLKYQMLDWLSAEIKSGADLYNTTYEGKTYGLSPLTSTGRYSTGKETFSEINSSFLLTANKDNLIDKFGIVTTFGGNLMSRKSNELSANAGELQVLNLFSLNNTKAVAPTVGENIRQHKINSLYGTFQLNYGGYAYIDLTGRNDWSSTLSKENRSFFYPSASASLVVSEMLHSEFQALPSWLSYAKIRGSYAVVGNDMGPYQLYNTYNLAKDPNGNTVASKNNILFNPDVKNELIKSTEIGVDLKFFDNRLGIDFSYYKTNATNQLINLPLNSLSGYSAKKVNAGNIQNEGFEVMVNAGIIRNTNFSWDTSVNVSRNKNTIIELADGVTQYSLGNFDALKILAVAGQGYGDIYGNTFKRVEDTNSPHFGKIIVDNNGVPEVDAEAYLGNQQPDALVGWTNTFNYKNLSLSFLIDGRFGGKIFAGTVMSLKANGSHESTVVNGERNKFVYDGVVSDGAGGYVPNTKEVSPEDFYTGLQGRSNIGIVEDNLFDASNIRLRNIQLNYNFSKDIVKAFGVQSAKVGLSVNNVLMLKSNIKGFDPESVFATGSNAVGLEFFSTPTSRTYFFNFSVSF